MDLRAIAFILFILMYVIMIAKPNWKIYAIWGVAIVFMLVGILRPNPLYILSVINWNVLMMIGGTTEPRNRAVSQSARHFEWSTLPR